MRIVDTGEASIAEAARLLKAGKLVAFPTETVYGLGANACDAVAVAAIFAAKERPRFNPLIVHVASMTLAETLAVFSPVARQLAEAFWPGPLTLVVPRLASSGLVDLVTAGLDTVGLRMPAHPVARRVLEAAGIPIAAPSANRSGHVSATTADHVAADLGAHVDLIIDAGPAILGIESTVIDATGEQAVLLRPGAVPTEAIEAFLGRPLKRAATDDTAPRSPGQLSSHYAPRAVVRLDARDVRQGEALLAFGPGAPATAAPTINLSESGDLIEAAVNLFAALRALDATGVTSIAVMPIPAHGLGEAINDRLLRAAAGKRPSG